MKDYPELKSKELFKEEGHSLAYPYILECEYPWEALPKIKDFIKEIIATLPKDEYECLGNDVFVAKSATVYPTATILGPTIIGPETEVRPGAFIRGNVIVGAHAVVGNSTELKNAILFDNVQVPHFNYVGDSILGYKAHTGAGAITSNVKASKTPVTILYKGERIETGLKKFGAILGDHAEIGCNAVLNPGSIIGRNSNVYPLSMVRGYIPSDSIYKGNDILVKKQ